MSVEAKRLTASEARARGRTKSQAQVRVERGFTDAERAAAHAWAEGEGVTSPVLNGSTAPDSHGQASRAARAGKKPTQAKT